MSLPMPAPVRSAIVGPGAIGGAIAGAIVQAGGSPLVCARTPLSKLTVDYPDGSIVAPVTCIVDPESAERVEIVILAVKAHQTQAASGWLRALTGPDTVLVVAQHGVEHREQGATIPDERPQQILDGMTASGLRHLSSISVDRLAGVATEWDARNQVIERLAERHDIAVPLNRWITALIRMGEPQE